MGRLMQANGEETAGLQEIQYAAQRAPSLLEAHKVLGLSALKAQNWKLAVAQFQGILVWNPKDNNARRLLGYSLAHAGRWKESISELRAADASLKNTADAHFINGLFLKQRGNEKAAEREFRIAQRLNPALQPPM